MLDGRNLLLAGLFLLAFVLLAFVVTAEVAFSQVREDRLERLVQRRVPGARRLAALQRSHESLAFAISTLRSGANAVLAISGFMLALRLVPHPLAAVPLGILLAVGGSVLAPAAGRVWGRIEPERIALTLVPLGILVEGTLGPLTRGLVALQRPLVRRWVQRRAKPPAPGAPAETPPPDVSVLEPPVPPTPAQEWERQVIRGVMRLQVTTVREIMVPRPDIVAVDVAASLEEAVAVVLREGYSRIPLYQGTMDKVEGILYAKDLLGAMRRDHATSLPELARPALMIPETKRLDDLLREFQEKRVQIALVVDEYGSVVGLVTNEDLLEEVVGEIEDEFAVHEPPVERLSDDETILDARMPLSYVSELFGVDLPAEGFDTLGGLIYHRLGRIPVPGESLVENELRLVVLSTAGRRIKRVRVTRTRGDAESPG